MLKATIENFPMRGSREMLRRMETSALVSTGWSAAEERVLRREIDQNLHVERRLVAGALNRWFLFELLADRYAESRPGRSPRLMDRSLAARRPRNPN